MQLRTSIAKRVSKSNLDGMDDEEEGRGEEGMNMRGYFPKSSLGMRDLGKYIGVLSE
jgi:hypothetical protein